MEVEVAVFAIFAAQSNLIGARLEMARDDCLLTFSSLVGVVELVVVGEEMDGAEVEGVGIRGMKSIKSSVGVNDRVWTTLGDSLALTGLTSGVEMTFDVVLCWVD